MAQEPPELVVRDLSRTLPVLEQELDLGIRLEAAGLSDIEELLGVLGLKSALEEPRLDLGEPQHRHLRPVLLERPLHLVQRDLRLWAQRLVAVLNVRVRLERGAN